MAKSEIQVDALTKLLESFVERVMKIRQSVQSVGKFTHLLDVWLEAITICQLGNIESWLLLLWLSSVFLSTKSVLTDFSWLFFQPHFWTESELYKLLVQAMVPST